MVPRLVLQFLGLPQVFLDDKPLSTDRRKALALLAYLAVNDVDRPPQKYSRESLSALLWPDYEQAKAFSNLRSILWVIRQAIGEGWLFAERETVQLNPEAEIDLDVARFRDLLSQSRQQNDSALRIALLSETVKLYRDHFLTGFSLKDAPNFNEWAFAESEDLRRKLAEALTMLLEDHCALGQAGQAIPYARRLVNLDPLNETTHRQLIEVYWQAGQHSAALKQYQACEQILRKELNLDPQPETRALYKKILKGEVKPTHIEMQTEAVVPKNNLPLQLSSFIGREKEQEEVIRLVKKNRLLTLVGAGGIGKSRLSIQVASALLNDFPNGLWLVELAPLSDPALVPQAIVTTLGLIDQAGRSPQMILADFLQTKRALLVLDNCEHFIQACAELAEALLRTCPDLHILATSREALGIAGETLYLVPALTTPDPVRVSLNTLPNYEAVQLFVERAQSALAGFMLTPENASTIAQICHQLDGIPLALELAAARIKMMSVEQIASHLNDRFHLLTGGARTALPRHQTLQAMIDWSHDLLSEPERVLLRRLSMFTGGWTLESAESVCLDEGIEKYEILDLLTQLLNKSLILAEHKQGQETRYRMLETICQYARGKLWAVHEGELMRQRHLAYFVDLAERAEPNLRAFDMIMWLDQLEAEHDNIRAALARALESNIEAELRLASALLWFWHIRGHRSEGLSWLERGISVGAKEPVDQPLPSSGTMILGKALNVAGFLKLILGELDTGVTSLEKSLALFRRLSPMHKKDLASVHWNLAMAASRQRAYSRAKTLCEESLALFREEGDQFGIAQCLDLLGRVALEEGDHIEARMTWEEDLALRKELGDKEGIADVLGYFGNLAQSQDDYQRATTLYEESLSLYREVGDRWMMGQALTDLGWVAYGQSDYDQATKRFEEALHLHRELGEKYAITNALLDLGRVVQFQRDYRQATKMLEEALHLARELNHRGLIVSALLELGEVAWSQGKLDAATQLYEEALVISREDKRTSEVAFALYCLGRVARSKANYASARSFYKQALIICRESSDQDRAAYILLEAFADLATAQQWMERATQLLGAIATIYSQTHLFRSPIERIEHDPTITAQVTLGEEPFAAAFEKGQKMTLDEAIAYALGEDS